MVPCTDRDAVLPSVRSAPGPEHDVVVVEIPPRAARRNRAAPAIALEHGIPMSRLVEPGLMGMLEQPLERAPGRLPRLREGGDRAAEEGPHAPGGEEPDIRLEDVGVGARTDLPRHRRIDQRRRDRVAWRAPTRPRRRGASASPPARASPRRRPSCHRPPRAASTLGATTVRPRRTPRRGSDSARPCVRSRPAPGPSAPRCQAGRERSD